MQCKVSLKCLLTFLCDGVVQICLHAQLQFHDFIVEISAYIQPANETNYQLRLKKVFFYVLKISQNINFIGEDKAETPAEHLTVSLVTKKHLGTFQNPYFS